MTRPFDVEAKEINRLNALQLTRLLKILLYCEAESNNIRASSVDVALNINVSDGGEDGRIKWSGGKENTDFLPKRLVCFQCKATKMFPKDTGKEVVTKDGKDINPSVDEVLSSGGAYIVFTTQKITKKGKNKRTKAIRESLGSLGKEYAENCVLEIYDASTISKWASCFVSAIVYVLTCVGRPMIRGLKVHSQWSKSTDITSGPFIEVSARTSLMEAIATDIIKPGTAIRLTGLSGLGKTRTAFQALDNEDTRHLVVYCDKNSVKDIEATLADWVTLGLRAVLVVDNCDLRTHQALLKEVTYEESKISLLTLDYSSDKASEPTKMLDLKRLSNEEISTILKQHFGSPSDLDRISRFAQGFPQIAILLANSRLSDDPRAGELSDDALLHKMLWGNEERNEDYFKILCACSLFDFFGVSDEVENQMEYISELINMDPGVVYGCIQEFTKKGILDRRNRYVQVVPKPLAVRLAGSWWENTREKKQREFIGNLPPDLIDSFCRQIGFLYFHENVKKLTDELCGNQGPFGNAGVIFSALGSKLFRALVEVNPGATSRALYLALLKEKTENVLEITGDARRNLVWALEKLCFHQHIFKESGWSLFKLAVAENETWGNNATGIFCQLFRPFLSGTGADFSDRLAVLSRGLNTKDVLSYSLIIKAASGSFKIRHVTRTVGAEHQGLTSSISEYKPSTWGEIHNYWKNITLIIEKIFSESPLHLEEIQSLISSSLWEVVTEAGAGLLFDPIIRQITDRHGKDWPRLKETINTIIEHTKQLRSEDRALLESWQKILEPDKENLEERISAIVINPPDEVREVEGKIVDISDHNASILGEELANELDSLSPYLDLLNNGTPKRASVFGYALGVHSKEPKVLVDKVCHSLEDSKTPNLSLLVGILRGVSQKSLASWESLISEVISIDSLRNQTVFIISTGRFNKGHLDLLVSNVKQKLIEPHTLNQLRYGSVTAHLSEEDISAFVHELSEISEELIWPAFGILFMFMHGRESSEVVKDELMELALKVPFSRNLSSFQGDTYQWCSIAKMFIPIDRSFSENILEKILSSRTTIDDYSLSTHVFASVMAEILKQHGTSLWSMIGDAIISSNPLERYRLKIFFGGLDGLMNRPPSSINLVDHQLIIDWCEKNSDIGPEFVASCIDIFDSFGSDSGIDKTPNKLFVLLLEKFGHREKIRQTLAANMTSGGWTNSRVPYLESDKKSLETLLSHPSENVIYFVSDMISWINKQIIVETGRDDEHELGIY